MKKIILFVLIALSAQFAESQTVESFKEEITKEKNIYIDFSGGFSYRLGKTVAESQMMEKHLKNLKNGFALDLSVFFRVKPQSNSFVGFKYNTFMRKSGMRGVYVYAPNGSEGYGEFSDDLNISFYGISYLYNKPTSKNDEYNFEASLGYIHYRDNAVYLQDYKITGGAIGLQTSVSYFIRISDNFYFGPKIGLMLGAVKKVNIDGPGSYHESITLKDDEKESLSKIDLSLALRLKL